MLVDVSSRGSRFVQYAWRRKRSFDRRSRLEQHAGDVVAGLVRGWRESIASVSNTARLKVERRRGRRKVREAISLRGADGSVTVTSPSRRKAREVMTDVTATAYSTALNVSQVVQKGNHR